MTLKGEGEVYLEKMVCFYGVYELSTCSFSIKFHYLIYISILSFNTFRKFDLDLRGSEVQGDSYLSVRHHLIWSIRSQANVDLL